MRKLKETRATVVYCWQSPSRTANQACLCQKSEVGLYLLNVLIKERSPVPSIACTIRSWDATSTNGKPWSSALFHHCSGGAPDPLLLLSGRLCFNIPVPTAFVASEWTKFLVGHIHFLPGLIGVSTQLELDSLGSGSRAWSWTGSLILTPHANKKNRKYCLRLLSYVSSVQPCLGRAESLAMKGQVQWPSSTWVFVMTQANMWFRLFVCSEYKVSERIFFFKKSPW